MKPRILQKEPYEVVSIIKSGDNEKLREVIEAGRVSPGCRDSSLLRVASGWGHLESVKLLLNWYKSTGVISQESVGNSLTPDAGNVAPTLVEHGMIADVITSALSTAIIRRHGEVAEVLLDNGADYNASFHGYGTALAKVALLLLCACYLCAEPILMLSLVVTGRL